MLQQYVDFCLYFSYYKLSTCFDIGLFYARIFDWKPFEDEMNYQLEKERQYLEYQYYHEYDNE